jgi:hypothetical protein
LFFLIPTAKFKSSVMKQKKVKNLTVKVSHEAKSIRL